MNSCDSTNTSNANSSDASSGEWSAPHTACPTAPGKDVPFLDLSRSFCSRLAQLVRGVRLLTLRLDSGERCKPLGEALAAWPLGSASRDACCVAYRTMTFRDSFEGQRRQSIAYCSIGFSDASSAAIHCSHGFARLLEKNGSHPRRLTRQPGCA
jgi:hypothetical protein